MPAEVRPGTTTMTASWVDELRATNYPAKTVQVRGLEVLSEVVVVRRRPIKHGPPDYVTVWVKSTCEGKSIENTHSFEPSDRYSREDFENDLERQRAWFADLFAQEILGTAPPKPVRWHVSVFNPADPSRRMNAAAICDPSVEHTKVWAEGCEALGLEAADGGRRRAGLKVLSKYFITEVEPADMSPPVVIGRDVIEAARAKCGEPDGVPLERLFVNKSTEAVLAHEEAKAKTVLVIGSHSDEGIRRMRQIEGFLFQLDYEPFLVKDFPTKPEALETKLLSFALMARCVVYEGSFASGAIDELKICKDNRIVTAVLHEKGRMATAMQADYGFDHPFIRFFPYEIGKLKETLSEAMAWAEDFVGKRRELYVQQMEAAKYR